MHDDEREVIRSEGLNPDYPAVKTAVEFVLWELSLYFSDQNNRRPTRLPNGR
jgi:hypothetical protein